MIFGLLNLDLGTGIQITVFGTQNVYLGSQNWNSDNCVFGTQNVNLGTQNKGYEYYVFGAQNVYLGTQNKGYEYYVFGTQNVYLGYEEWGLLVLCIWNLEPQIITTQVNVLSTVYFEFRTFIWGFKIGVMSTL